MSTFALLALPPEIIRLICASVCAHCTPLAQPFMSFLEPWDTQYKFERQKDLLNLCRTCQSIRAFATHHRLHCVPKKKRAFAQWGPGDIGLLANVRECEIDGDVASWFPPTWDPAFCISHAQQQLNMDLAEYENGPVTVFGAEFFLASLTNLRNLTFHVDDSEEQVSNTILCNYLQSFKQVPALHRLKTLNILPRHGEVRFGVHCVNPGIRMLIQRSPNLRHLRLHNLIVTADIPQELEPYHSDGVTPTICADFVRDTAASLKNVRILELINCGIQDDDASLDSSEEFNWLRDTINNCESLERFTLGDFAFDTDCISCQITPARVLDALSDKAETLRELDLGMDRRASDTRRVDETVCRSVQLKRFTQLETLRLHCDAYCLCRVRLADGKVKHSCLTNLLPQSVRILGLWMNMSGSWGDIFRLGDSIRKGRFPNLKRLEVSFIYLNDFDNLIKERDMAIKVVNAFYDTNTRVSVKAVNSYGHVWLPKFLCLAERN